LEESAKLIADKGDSLREIF